MKNLTKSKIKFTTPIHRQGSTMATLSFPISSLFIPHFSTQTHRSFFVTSFKQRTQEEQPRDRWASLLIKPDKKKWARI